MYWIDIEDIAETLEENYPEEELSSLKLSYLEEMVRLLNEFEDNGVATTKETLDEIREAWRALR